MDDNMVFVKSGCYQMGDENGWDDEKFVHRVCVDDFYLGKYEVTIEEFKKFVADTGYMTDAERGEGCNYKDGTDPAWKIDKGRNWRNPGFTQTDKHPATCISWNDANEYIKWLNRRSNKKNRFPTEAEWEYAAKSGGKSERWGGTDKESELRDYAWYRVNSDGRSHRVGQKKPNSFGLYDMIGNLWEWVADWYDGGYYRKSPVDNPKGPFIGQKKAVRGGCFLSASAAGVSRRVGDQPSWRETTLGFRIARSAK